MNGLGVPRFFRCQNSRHWLSGFNKASDFNELLTIRPAFDKAHLADEWSGRSPFFPLSKTRGVGYQVPMGRQCVAVAIVFSHHAHFL